MTLALDAWAWLFGGPADVASVGDLFQRASVSKPQLAWVGAQLILDEAWRLYPSSVLAAISLAVALGVGATLPRTSVRNVLRALEHQFPELLILTPKTSSEKWLRSASIGLLALCIMTLLATDNELAKLVASAPLGLFTAVTVFLLFRGFRLYLQAHDREHGAGRSLAVPADALFDGSGPAIPWFPLPQEAAQMPVRYSPGDYYQRPGPVADFLAWHEAEMRAAFVMSRGALDRPKINLAQLSYGAQPELRVGGCSYYDHFCLHHSAKRELSSVPISTGGERPYTSVQFAYEDAAVSWLGTQSGPPSPITPLAALPNGLGISGLVRVCCSGRETLWLLQTRGGVERADAGLLDCTFAGMIEVELFLDGKPRRLADVLKLELLDETPPDLRDLVGREASCEPKILIFEPDRLYQPEIIALYTIDGDADLYEAVKQGWARAGKLAIAEAGLLRSIQRVIAGDPDDLGYGRRRYDVKDNLATMLAFLAREGTLAPIPPPSAR